MTKAVGIIGGGISGTLVVLNLLKQSRRPLTVIWFDSKNLFCRGLAYSTPENCHLLNVRAANMSAFTDEPNHFVNWLQQTHTGFVARDFVPRKLYGQYIQQTYEALKIENPQLTIIHKAEEVVSILPAGTGYTIRAKGLDIVQQVVLAVGNFLPAHPRSVAKAFITSPNYFQNVFEGTALKKALHSNSVTIIGAGLTMVDMVVALKENNYTGVIQVISPHGYLPQAHTEEETSRVNDFLNFNTAYTLAQVFSAVKHELKQAVKTGKNPQGIIDAMRPYLQHLWVNFSIEDKKQFLRHLRHKWGVARHRAPASGIKTITGLISQKQLQPIKGRIFNIETSPQGFEIEYTDATSQKNYLKSGVILNCTGPEPDFNKADSLLVKQLIHSTLITGHELFYGINAPKTGILRPGFFTLGPPLKGVLWESTAVPEIRLQAKEIASKIILD